MNLFDLNGKNAALLGGGGVLGGAMARGLAAAGANVAVCDLREDLAKAAAEEAGKAGVRTTYHRLDAMNKNDLEAVCADIYGEFPQVDILVNAVGGNAKAATTNDAVNFFGLDTTAVEKVFSLNLMAGAVMPAQVFGRRMVENEHGGVIVNISSMNAFRPLTKIPGYSAAKAGVSNFTQWLAADLSMNFNANLRVNAIAPGFFLTDQNRFLLTEEKTGALTKRGEQILAHTPMGRFGAPEDLIGTLVWLCSDAARFVTGIVVPVDGGFSAYSGV
jgi:NAD(P)-dependent dehydrogenase (short-subunit alcohol dehydrogenase family)